MFLFLNNDYCYSFYIIEVAILLQVFELNKIEVFVLDEADVMIDTQGFRDHSIRLHKQCPNTCQFLLFSATYDEPVMKFAQQIVRDPNLIRVSLYSYCAYTLFLTPDMI